MTLLHELSPFETIPIAFALVLARVSSFIVAAPAFSQGTVPTHVKFGLCVALSVFFLPGYIDAAAELRSSHGALILALFAEIVAGYCVGYLVGLMLLPVRIAGTYIGQELGFSLGQVADPTSGAASNETGLLFDAVGLLLFWTTDVHHQSLRMLASSTNVLQVDREFLLELADASARLISQSHDAAFVMIAPLASVLFLILTVLLVMMRSWPQVTLFSFGSGARLIAGLAAFVFFAPTIISNMTNILHEMAHLVADSQELPF